MKDNDYYNICNFAQKFYKEDPALLPTNNIITIWRAQIKSIMLLAMSLMLYSIMSILCI